MTSVCPSSPVRESARIASSSLPRKGCALQSSRAQSRPPPPQRRCLSPVVLPDCLAPCPVVAKPVPPVPMGLRSSFPLSPSSLLPPFLSMSCHLVVFYLFCFRNPSVTPAFVLLYPPSPLPPRTPGVFPWCISRGSSLRLRLWWPPCPPAPPRPPPPPPPPHPPPPLAFAML